MPLKDLSGVTFLGVSTEAWLAERAREDEQKADVWKRLQLLEQLQADFEVLRKKHQELEFELRDLGMRLGLVQADAIQELRTEPDDAA